MPVRIATFADLKSIAEILAAAFYDEELNAYFFPNRKQYPEDYVHAWYQVVLERWWNCDNVWLVSYTDRLIDSNGIAGRPSEVTGAAQWATELVQSGWLGTLQYHMDLRRYFVSLVTWYLSAHRRLFPNRSIASPSPRDPQPLLKWEFGRAIWPFCKRYYTQPAARQGRWQLNILGVHPVQQKCGFARELIAWGLQRANEQKLPAVVIMARDLEEFYAKQGFRVLVGYATTDDVTIEEENENGNKIKREIVNPLR